MRNNNLKNMRELLEMMEVKLAGRRIFRYMEGEKIVEVSSEQFFDDVKEASWQLIQKELNGKHIGVIGKNSYRWMVSFCAIFWAGAVPVLLSWESGTDMISELAERVELDAVFYDEVTYEDVRKAGLSEHLHMISMNEKAGKQILGRSKDKLCKIEKKVVDTDLGPEDLACIFFTSGTTSKNKAVMMSERGLIASVCTRLNCHKFNALLAILPFHHMAGFITVLNTLYLESEVCIAGDLKYFYKYLKEMRPDYVFLVPSMLKMLARKLKNGGQNGNYLGWDLHIISCGGAAFCPEFLEMLRKQNITVLQAYGASEAGAIGFLWEMTPGRPNTIGKPTSDLETKIVNGELYLRSESVMMGYYKDAEETKKVLRDGWYATGDLCKKDEDGYFYLTGRSKNLIILSNGENVSPEEIETKLYAHEEIREIMIGVEHDLITATIYPNYLSESDEESKLEIKEQIKKEVTEYNVGVPIYKQIQIVHFLEEPFAKTAMGKLIRHSVTGG